MYMAEVELIISSLNKKGYGEGLYSDSPVAVKGALPGEKIVAALGKKRRKKHQGNLLNIITPSPHRVEERCTHAVECGGCSFQALAYEEQLRLKEKAIRELFEKDPLPIIGCDTPFYGRNKMEFTFSQNRAGEKFLGLILAGSKGYVFNLQECHMASPWFAESVKAVRAFWESSDLTAYHGPSDTGHLRTLTLRESAATGERMVILTVSGNPAYALKKDHIEAFKRSVSASSLFIRIQQVQKGSPTQFFEMHLEGSAHIKEILTVNERKVEFAISPTSFFQPQSRQAEKLYTRALELLSLKGDERLFDLYCGTGTMALLFAPYVKEVIGIELNPYAVIDAEEAAQRNGVHNARFLKGDVGEVLQELKGRGVTPDVVIVDPPRVGLDRAALEHLLTLLPEKILYISCNPKTQKENHQTLSSHYEIVALQPLDQFPHSPHIENILLLHRKT